MIRNKLQWKLTGLLTLLSATCLGTTLGQAATFTWNGAGVSGGTADTAWNTSGNWTVSGVDGDGIPDADDNVDIFFNQNYGGGSFAVIVPHGATASRVRINGYGGTTTGRVVQIGTTSGDVINWGKSQAIDTNNSSESWRVLSGVTLNLNDSGSLSNPTWIIGRTTSSNNQGTVNLTNSGTVYVDNAFHSVDPVFLSNIHFTSPASTVQFRAGNQLMSHGAGTVEFFSTQTITGLSLADLNSGALVSGDANLLSNFSNVLLRKDNNDNRGGSATFAGGTYRALVVSDFSGQSASGSPSLRAAGDTTFVGHSNLNMPQGNGAIEIYMRDNRTDTGTLDMRGYDLTVSSSSPVIIGSTTANNTNVLQLSNPGGSGTDGTTADIASSLDIKENGEIRGDAETVIQLSGNFQNASTHNAGFDLEASTLVMDGSATMGAPQLLEVQGLDIGANAAGLVDNFGIGDLVIGTPGLPTYVQLVDMFDFQADSLADALYVSGSTLTVNSGSTLDLNGFHLYEGGVLIKGGSLDSPFVTAEGGFIVDSQLPPVPEPGSLCLLGLGACLLYWKRTNDRNQLT